MYNSGEDLQMEQVGTETADADIPVAGDWKGAMLAIALMLIAGGFLPVFSFYSRFSTWGLWAIVLVLVVLAYKDLPMRGLMKPAMPYLWWLLGFIAWGLIVSPVPSTSLAIKVFVTTIIVTMAMAIITSSPVHLRQFANAMQWMILGNLLLLPLMNFSLVSQFLVAAIPNGLAYGEGLSRFAGAWGNPNMAGYMCLIAIVLSVWASPALAWIGRFSALPILYLSASRKSMVLLLLFLLLNIAIVQRHRLDRLLAWTLGLLMLASLVLLSDSALRTARSRVEGDTKITRMLDLTESDTVELGGETRVDLLQQWLQTASTEPWHGFGFGAMAGRYDTEGKLISARLPRMGSHNTYLGVYIEAGALGLLTFIAILLYYSKSYLVFRGERPVRWALMSLFACNMIFLVVSHSHLFSFEGKVAYALFFLLPTCPALNRGLHAD